MSLRLRDDLHWCDCGGRILFLDVSADRYFALPASARDAFLALAAGTAGPREAGQLGMLTERGLLFDAHSEQPFRQPASIETPTRDILDGLPSRTGCMPVLRAFCWEWRAAWELRTGRLCGAIARAGRRGSKGPDVRSPGIVVSIAAAADAIAFVTRSHNRCLVRALAVHAACRSAGVRARLVIGVIAHPFAAHSWVQWGDAVLVGGFEQARLYTPVLVVE